MISVAGMLHLRQITIHDLPSRFTRVTGGGPQAVRFFGAANLVRPFSGEGQELRADARGAPFPVRQSASFAGG